MKFMKKLETRKLVASLEQKSRKDKKALWKDLAERIGKPTRHNVTVSIAKLDSMAKLNKGKILVVPGKILSDGELTEKVTIVGVTASEKATEKISQSGEFIFLKDFIQKGDPSKIIIVK
jgi:large subunit ribosomal protein L18e